MDFDDDFDDSFLDHVDLATPYILNNDSLRSSQEATPPVDVVSCLEPEAD